MENEFEDIRGLLQNIPLRASPHGLDQKIMDKVVAFETKRRRQRLALASWLRFVSVGLLLILLGRILGPQVSGNVGGKPSLPEVANWAQKSGDAGRWLLEHAYYFLPLLLFLFRRMVNSRPR